MYFSIHLLILFRLFIPISSDFKDDLHKDIDFLTPRTELIDFQALRRAAADLSEHYPEQYDLQSVLDELNLYEKDYER